MRINGETKIIGFLGATHKTSKMYALYNAAFEAVNLNYIYAPFAATEVGKAIDAIRHLGIHAVGVTIPFKVSCIPFLDRLDDNAKRIGSVNVILNKNGVLTGSNTDGHGAVRALKEKTQIKGKNVVLLGAGGAARAIAFTLKDNGAHVTILNRTITGAKELSKAVGCQFDGINSLANHIQKNDILVHATPVGMWPDIHASLVGKPLLHAGLVVQELVSNPKETQLVTDAKTAGCTIVNADRMLLWQAVLKFQLYTGVEAPISAMERTLQETE